MECGPISRSGLCLCHGCGFPKDFWDSQWINVRYWSFFFKFKWVQYTPKSNTENLCVCWCHPAHLAGTWCARHSDQSLPRTSASHFKALKEILLASDTNRLVAELTFAAYLKLLNDLSWSMAVIDFVHISERLFQGKGSVMNFWSTNLGFPWFSPKNAGNVNYRIQWGSCKLRGGVFSFF